MRQGLFSKDYEHSIISSLAGVHLSPTLNLLLSLEVDYFFRRNLSAEGVLQDVFSFKTLARGNVRCFLKSTTHLGSKSPTVFAPLQPSQDEQQTE